MVYPKLGEAKNLNQAIMNEVYNKSRAEKVGVFGTGLSDKFNNTENVCP